MTVNCHKLAVGGDVFQETQSCHGVNHLFARFQEVSVQVWDKYLASYTAEDQKQLVCSL